MSTCLALYLVSKLCGSSNVLVVVHKIHRYTPSHNCVLYLIHIYQSQDCISYVSESQLTSSSHSLQDPVRLSQRLDITQYRRLQSSKRSKEDLVRQPSETILNGLFPGDSHPTRNVVTPLSPTRGSRPLCMVKGNKKED